MTRTRKPAWSFVVMRGPDKTVRQFKVSKRSVVAAPMAAALAVAGTVAGLQLKAAYELRQLESELSNQSAAFTQTIAGMDAVIAGKDEAIVTLQQEILKLSRQTEDMKIKMQELGELEEKLKLFMEKYGGSVPNTASPTASESSKTSASGKDAASFLPSFSAYSSLSDKVARSPIRYPVIGNLDGIVHLAKNTSIDLKALSRMVDAMEESMAHTLKQAQNRRMTVDAYPSSWPTRSKQLTSGFGYRRDPFTGHATFHAGIDIDGKSGDTVFSAAEGTVSETGYDSQYGNYIIIDHLGHLQTAYMHLLAIDAREGDTVVRGEKIGQLGSSGRSTGPHLHFQIMQRSEPVNPLKYLASRT